MDKIKILNMCFIIWVIFIVLIGFYMIKKFSDIARVDIIEHDDLCYYDKVWEIELNPYVSHCVNYHHWDCFVPVNLTILKVVEKIECYEERCLMDCDNLNETICKVELSECEIELDNISVELKDGIVYNHLDKKVHVTLNGIKNVGER